MFDNRKLKKIYIDMDGVLADFDDGVRELLGLEPEPQGKQTQSFQNKMWQKLSEYGHFYRDLKPEKGAVEGFQKLFAKYGDKVEILTGIPKPRRNVPSAGEDKKEWVKKYLSDDVKVNIVYREEKKNCCLGKEYLLIDDYKKNTDEWILHGGTAVLFDGWDKIDL